MRRLFVFAFVMSAAMPLGAQSSAEVNGGIQYNFSSPGARSLGRAGAFIADASDATAAYANPAGLVNLPERELSMELRASQFTHTFADRGHAFGPPSNSHSDTIAGIREGSLTSRIDNVAFASVVVPFERFTLAAYRHELVNFEANAKTQGVFYDLVTPEGKIPGYRQFPAIGSLRLRIAGEGLAAGFRATPRLSLGIGVRRYDARLDSTTDRYYPPIPFDGLATYTQLYDIQHQSGHGRAYGLNAGVVFDFDDRLSVGASYRQGFSFATTATNTRDVGTVLHGAFNVPTFYGAGVNVRPNPQWSVSLDVNHILYSELTRHFVLLFEEEPRYFAPNGVEVRLGSEWLLTRDQFAWLRVPITVSVGGWRDPDHTIRVSDLNDSQAILFRKGSDDYHVTAGLGVVIKREAQIHIAYDHGQRQSTGSLSAMVRF